ncbi:MAG: PAS domain S-box protein [Deltaproteobacteria bacterium]|nr:PAS domain S-box protein [Deltaproteobacteria bacterium]
MRENQAGQNHEKNEPLREGEDKYRQLINQMLNGYALHKIICNDQGQPIDYRFLEVNPAFEHITGLKAESVLGRTVLEVLPQTEPSWIEKYGKVALTGESIHFENYHRQINRYFDVTAFRPAPNQFACYFTDITERKRTEKLLRESERDLKEAQHIAHMGRWKLNLVSNTLQWSDDIFEIFEIDHETFGASYETFLHAIHPDDREMVNNTYKTSLRDKLPYDIKHRLLMKDGRIKWVNEICRSEFDEDGKPLCSIGIVQDITELKQAEETLMIEKEFSVNLLETANAFILTLDINANITLFNKFAAKLTGYKSEEVLGKNWFDLFIPKRNGSVIGEVFSNALGGISEFSSYDNPILLKNGSERIISWENTVLKDENGEISGVLSIGTDITERKRAEEELLKIRERLELAMDAGEHGFWDWNLDTNDVYFSPCYYTMLGYEPGELPMKLETWTNLMHPDDKKTIVPEVENYVKNARAYEVEFRLKTKDGDWKWISGRGKSFKKDIDGIPHRAVGVHVDITERKRAELALSAEKERLTVTLRSIGDGVITTDLNGNIVMLNEAAKALTGWNSDEAAGRPLPEVFNIINKRTRQQCENPVEKVLTTRGIVELAHHTCLIAKDGREIVIADSGAPIRDSESLIIGVVLVFRDMTEKQKLNDFMQRAHKLESLGVLAGGIAHDFNNLLGAIFGYIEMAIVETTEENVSTCLAESLSNIDRARALTQQLLTFAKGGAPIKKVENLFPFVQKNAQFALSGSSVSSRFQIQENLWPCDFDKNQIGQVIDNLTINAQQAMPNGGTIEVSARNISLAAKEHISLAAGNYVKLSIKDQGIGIPKEFLPRIFDPYYTTKSKGHGLGLSTCYSIVNRHGGCIDVESEPGKGSTFHLYLPASIESISTIAGKSAGKHTGSGTFLVMDDEEAIRNIIKIILESFGYTVVLKENGKDAIDFLETEIKANRKLAGMIFDLTIPGGMGGKEAIGEIRKICSNTPAFVASGYSNDPIMANPEEYGFNASICKPFKMAELSEMLEKHLKKLK